MTSVGGVGTGRDDPAATELWSNEVVIKEEPKLNDGQRLPAEARDLYH